jgi:hypothetical protein
MVSTVKVPPDGGYGWVIVLASAASNVSCHNCTYTLRHPLHNIIRLFIRFFLNMTAPVSANLIRPLRDKMLSIAAHHNSFDANVRPHLQGHVFGNGSVGDPGLSDHKPERRFRHDHGVGQRLPPQGLRLPQDRPDGFVSRDDGSHPDVFRHHFHPLYDHLRFDNMLVQVRRGSLCRMV